MASLHESNAELLAALAILAPEDNVRVALVNMIEFMEDCDDETMFNRRLVLEIIARGIVDLGWRVRPGEEDFEDLSELTLDDAVAQFRKQLQLEEEEDVD